MKLVTALALASLCLLAIPSASAADPPACAGYEWCDEETGNGFALFCVKYKSNWVCGECEACGNGPFGRDPA